MKQKKGQLKYAVLTRLEQLGGWHDIESVRCALNANRTSVQSVMQRALQNQIVERSKLGTNRYYYRSKTSTKTAINAGYQLPEPMPIIPTAIDQWLYSEIPPVKSLL